MARKNTTKWYLEHDNPSLYSWVAGHMAKGALYGAAVFVGCLLFVAVFYWLSLILPENPYAMIGQEALTRIG